jgi:hypothetical protein
MLTKVMAILMILAVGALVLEVVFGVHLGIAAWVHRVLDTGQAGFVRL